MPRNLIQIPESRGFVLRLTRRVAHVLLCLAATLTTGCYAPLTSRGIPANTLSDSFRVPERSLGLPLNLSSLTSRPPEEYVIGSDDLLEVEIHNLFADPRAPRVHKTQVRVMGSGDILLPHVGSVQVQGMNLSQVRNLITKTYVDGFIREPHISVFLVEASTTNVLVLGEVSRPGAYRLPKYENDIGHALAVAGGLTQDAGNEIQVHRRVSGLPPLPAMNRLPGRRTDREINEPAGESGHDWPNESRSPILTIQLRSFAPMAPTPEDVTLKDGEVVFVPSRTNEVFFVVGKLSSTNFIRFSLGKENRDLGIGFVLPRDRDVDVVTAVAMAGYIDPIDSPTTVTVHRTLPDGSPMLIYVDLIAARFDRKETIMVEAGDIIYLNPDGAWWFRRTLDRILPDLLVLPFESMILEAFD